jgi:hypothetical protein
MLLPILIGIGAFYAGFLFWKKKPETRLPPPAKPTEPTQPVIPQSNFIPAAFTDGQIVHVDGDKLQIESQFLKAMQSLGGDKSVTTLKDMGPNVAVKVYVSSSSPRRGQNGVILVDGLVGDPKAGSMPGGNPADDAIPVTFNAKDAK